jgi:hypothetical protein
VIVELKRVERSIRCRFVMENSKVMLPFSREDVLNLTRSGRDLLISVSVVIHKAITKMDSRSRVQTTMLLESDAALDVCTGQKVTELLWEVLWFCLVGLRGVLLVFNALFICTREELVVQHGALLDCRRAISSQHPGFETRCFDE